MMHSERTPHGPREGGELAPEVESDATLALVSRHGQMQPTNGDGDGAPKP